MRRCADAAAGRRARVAATTAAALLLAGCFARPATKDQDGFPEPNVVPANLEAIPDAVPHVEPRSKYGNPAEYEVAGDRYFVLTSAAGYRERGRASWYGTKFHGKRTSSGEAYDMFGMTAAHKTLPLPTYVRVTNLENGRSVVVKVNDRGPFHQGRIIDLSYAAAAKLDMLSHGSTEVEVEAIDPSAPPVAVPAAAAAAPPQFLEIGSTDDPIYAVALREQAIDLGLTHVEIRSEETPAEVVHRVLVGPFRDGPALAEARSKLEARHVAAKTVDR